MVHDEIASSIKCILNKNTTQKQQWFKRFKILIDLQMIHSLLVASLKKTSCVFFVFFSAAGRQWTSPCLPTATFSTWATWSAAFRRRACTEWWAQVRRDLAFDLSLLAAAWVVVACCCLLLTVLLRRVQRGTSTTRPCSRGAAPPCGRWRRSTWRWWSCTRPAACPLCELTSSNSGTTRTFLFLWCRSSRQACVGAISPSLWVFFKLIFILFFYFFMFVAESFPGCAAFLFFLQSSGFCYHHLVWWALWITLHDINMPYAGHTQRQCLNMLRIQVAGLWMQFDFIWVLMWFIYLLNYEILKIQNTKEKKNKKIRKQGQANSGRNRQQTR